MTTFLGMAFKLEDLATISSWSRELLLAFGILEIAFRAFGATWLDSGVALQSSRAHPNFKLGCENALPNDCCSAPACCGGCGRGDGVHRGDGGEAGLHLHQLQPDPGRHPAALAPAPSSDPPPRPRSSCLDQGQRNILHQEQETVSDGTK